jgi:hypothetical protein
VSVGATGLPDPDPQAVRALAILSAIHIERLPVLSSHSGATEDSVSTSLRELASPAFENLFHLVEERLSHTGAQHLVAVQNPNHPAWVPQSGAGGISPDLRDSAERSVARAAHAVAAAGKEFHRIPDGLDPLLVVATATQLIETGQVLNYLRAGELGRIVLSWYDGSLPVRVGLGPGGVRLRPNKQLGLQVVRVVRRLWHRVPMLILLTAWLVTGTFAGAVGKMENSTRKTTALVFGIWATGFLALVVFQFVMTIRGALRRKAGFSSQRK